MPAKDFSTTLLVDRPAKEVFEAINKPGEYGLLSLLTTIFPISVF